MDIGILENVRRASIILTEKTNAKNFVKFNKWSLKMGPCLKILITKTSNGKRKFYIRF